MTYRDDAEAAKLRADALERDRAELEAKLAALQPAPGPAPEAKPKRPSLSLADIGGKRGLLGVVVGTLIIGVVIPAWRCRADERAARVAKRFAAFIRLSECYRASLEDDIEVPTDLTDSYVRVNEISLCDGAIETGLGDETWRRAMVERNAAVAGLHDYYGHQDYQDDHYAGTTALWKRASSAARANNAAAHAALAELPAIERGIRAEQGTTRDGRWWRLELAAQLQRAHDRVLRGEPASPVDIAGAPPEIKEVLRDLTYPPDNELFRNQALEALAHE